MSEDDDDDDFEQIARIGNEVMDVLTEESVLVKLLNGDKITGSLVGFLSKKVTQKGRQAA